MSEEVELEEVQAPAAVQFPAESAGQSANSATSGASAWLTWLAVLLGLVGIGVGVVALQKK